MDPKVQQIMAQYPNVPPQIAQLIASGQLPIWAASVASGMSGSMQDAVNPTAATNYGANPTAIQSQLQAPDPTMAMAAIPQAADPAAASGPPDPQAQPPQAPQANPTSTAQSSDEGAAPTSQDSKGPNQGPPPPPAGGPGGAPSQAAPSTPPGAGPYNASPADLQETRFGFDPNKDNAGSWASKVFLNGSMDQGRDFSNTSFAHSPFGSFLQSRYTPELESNLLTGLMNGQVGDGGQASFAQHTLQDLSAGGGSAAGGHPFSALQQAAGNLHDFGSGATFGNVGQTTALGQIGDDTQAQSNTILGALRGATGGFGMNYAQQALGDQQRLYGDNPAQYKPTDFMQAALQKLGIR
jgi:hypothetical protein